MSRICVNSNNIDDLPGEFTNIVEGLLIDNCEAYDSEGVCVQCVNGYNLLEDGGDIICMQTCELEG